MNKLPQSPTSRLACTPQSDNSERASVLTPSSSETSISTNDSIAEVDRKVTIQINRDSRVRSTQLKEIESWEELSIVVWGFFPLSTKPPIKNVIVDEGSDYDETTWDQFVEFIKSIGESWTRAVVVHLAVDVIESVNEIAPSSRQRQLFAIQGFGLVNIIFRRHEVSARVFASLLKLLGEPLRAIDEGPVLDGGSIARGELALCRLIKYRLRFPAYYIKMRQSYHSAEDSWMQEKVVTPMDGPSLEQDFKDLTEFGLRTLYVMAAIDEAEFEAAQYAFTNFEACEKVYIENKPFRTFRDIGSVLGY